MPKWDPHIDIKRKRTLYTNGKKSTYENIVYVALYDPSLPISEGPAIWHEYRRLSEKAFTAWHHVMDMFDQGRVRC